jgi:hypothetical protein
MQQFAKLYTEKLVRGFDPRIFRKCLNFKLMTREEIDNYHLRVDNTVEYLNMNMRFIAYSLNKVTLSEEELNEMMNFYLNKEDYKLCNELIKLRNGC